MDEARTRTVLLSAAQSVRLTVLVVPSLRTFAPVALGLAKIDDLRMRKSGTGSGGQGDDGYHEEWVVTRDPLTLLGVGHPGDPGIRFEKRLVPDSPVGAATAVVKSHRERIRRSITLFVKEISQMVNDLDLLLDDFEVQDDKRNRGRLLERALLLSIRGLNVLVQEPFVTSPTDYLLTMQERLDHNPWKVQEELRHDSTTLTLFLVAECRLLADLGVSESAVNRIRDALEGAIWEFPLDRVIREPPHIGEIREPYEYTQDIRDRMQSLIETLTGELDRLYDDTRHKKLIAQLAGVFETLGGALLVAGNAAAGAIGTPVTAGLSAAGAALSTAAGVEVISRGVDRAKS